LRGAEAKLIAIRSHRAALPDLAIHPDMITLDEVQSTVAVHWTMTGTDTVGLRGHPPTGRSIRIWGSEHFGLRSGRVLTNWVGVAGWEPLPNSA